MAAKREGQGLQIAVITFAMLTIILAITTYVFYAQSVTAQKDLDAKTKAVSEQQNINNKLMFREKALKYVLGAGTATKEEMDLAKSTAGGEDEEVKTLLDNYNQDVALVESLLPEGPRNYRTINQALLTALMKSNASTADALAQARDATRQREASEKAEKARADEAKAGMDKAAADHAAEHALYVSSKAESDDEKNKLAEKANQAAAAAKSQIDKLGGEREKGFTTIKQQQDKIQSLLENVKDLEKDKVDLFAHPDGHIVLVNQSQRLTWIDVGRADGLLRQTTFSVYDHDANGVTNAKQKGRIEVTTLGDHQSEARILEDSPANPILNGDIIATPAWSPGQRIHFALALKMDVNKDGVDDYQMVKNVIEMNGGVIDAELRPDGSRHGKITVNTRYFVQGDKMDEKTPQEVIKQFGTFDTERANNGVEKLPVQKLLTLMGWKADQKTVELGGNRGAGVSFQKRAPGKTQPAAGGPAGSPAEAPATSAPAAGGVDPFGAPAGGAAAPAADPFSAPAGGSPKPATGEVDPFATPK
jgi:hypothetical protein